MSRLTKLEKFHRRQRQTMRRTEQAKKRRKRNVYLRHVAQYAKAKR